MESPPSSETPNGTSGTEARRPHVLALGGGFAGIGAAQKLKQADVDVTLVDKHDYPTIQSETINLDMEFSQEGAEGATPCEVLLHAAMVGQSTRLTRQDGVEEAWRIMQPLLGAPPPVHSYPSGFWGPAAPDDIVAAYRRWHTPWEAS